MVGHQSRKAWAPPMSRVCSLRIAAKLENLVAIRQFIEESASALGSDPRAVPDLLLAVDEAATNIIIHGYRGQSGFIEIEVSQMEDSLVICLCDQAPLFDPTQVPPPDLGLPLEMRPAGGLGIYLVRQLLDKVTHSITPDGGNQLMLVKRGVLKSQPSQKEANLCT